MRSGDDRTPVTPAAYLHAGQRRLYSRVTASARAKSGARLALQNASLGSSIFRPHILKRDATWSKASSKLNAAGEVATAPERCPPNPWRVSVARKREFRLA